ELARLSPASAQRRAARPLGGHRPRQLENHLALRRLGCRGRGPDRLPLGALAMPMKNPPHPGRIVRQECLEPLRLSVTDAAKSLGVSRNALSELVNERRGISPEMAIRLAKAFGSSAAVWAGL